MTDLADLNILKSVGDSKLVKNPGMSDLNNE